MAGAGAGVRRGSVQRSAGRTPDESGWAWAPYAPEEPVDLARYRVEDWAPASTVRHPWVRVGRFTLLYRRSA